VDGRDLAALVFSPDGAKSSRAPAILLFHGGGWVAGQPEWTFEAARRFEQLGLVAVAIEYRLSVGNVTPIEALADACEAFRWVRHRAPDLGVDPLRVAAYGVSAGGQLVAAAATLGCGTEEGRYGNGGPDALVLWSPALDVGGDGWFARLLQGRARPAEYSPVEHMPPRVAPTSIVQGAEDTLTPLAGARRFCERALSNGSRCEVHVYPGLGHLLTRNLGNQEDDYDPDPVAREDGIAKQLDFLREIWLEPQG
jgi:acetyl esterase/lipase